MSYHEALADGIPMREVKGGSWYYPPCRICGAQVASWGYRRDVQYVCGECRKELVALDRQERAALSNSKVSGRLSTAIKRISKVSAIEPYAAAITWASENIDKPGWFQSTEEIMVALELIRRGIKAHHQVPIHGCRVDFILPDMKVALEVDGEVFHGRERLGHEQVRDEVITYQLGPEWEVVHIKTNNINTNITRLVPAIKAVLARRAKKSSERLCREN